MCTMYTVHTPKREPIPFPCLWFIMMQNGSQNVSQKRTGVFVLAINLLASKWISKFGLYCSTKSRKWKKNEIQSRKKHKYANENQTHHKSSYIYFHIGSHRPRTHTKSHLNKQNIYEQLKTDVHIHRNIQFGAHLMYIVRHCITK